MVWNALKKNLLQGIHPQTLKELADGVMLFWKTKFDAAYCIKKIDHLQKVVSKVISVTGKASGYYSNSFVFVPVTLVCVSVTLGHR